MATTKRGAHDIHPSRQNLLPREQTNSRKRQKPSNLSGTKSFKKARPVNELKTSIRNLRRLLDRAPDATTGKEALPPKIRIAKERELASAQHELAESQAAEARSKMIARYHKVRFFDRQKATKRLKRARKAMKEVEDDAEERERLALEADECEVDVQYAMYYPLDVAYVALYPSVRKVEGKEEEEGRFRGAFLLPWGGVKRVGMLEGVEAERRARELWKVSEELVGRVLGGKEL